MKNGSNVIDFLPYWCSAKGFIPIEQSVPCNFCGKELYFRVPVERDKIVALKVEHCDYCDTDNPIFAFVEGTSYEQKIKFRNDYIREMKE